MDELKTCPCCKGTPELQDPNPEPTNASMSEYYVECLGCGLSSGTHEFMDEAIKAWNTRTPELPNPCSVEQWEEITGETFPDDGIVFYKVMAGKTKMLKNPYFEMIKYRKVKLLDKSNLYIVQTAKPGPETP